MAARHNHRVTTSRTAAALFLTVALALTGCGGDDDEPAVAAESAGNDASAYAPPEVTANAIDLGKEPKSAAGSGAVTTLQTKDLVVGKGTAAELSDTVTVHYVGTLFSDGSVFDSSWSRGAPVPFPLSNVVPGFAQGIAGMKVGGRRQIVIPAGLAYGAAGRPGIPPNSPLVFIVDLKAIG